jgi:catechol 2,3-dioxygenase-like lactoylglutathione lyase family enzyme
MLSALHHIQLAMPEGGEAQARAFYGGLLGLPEAAKSAALAGRGGVWFETATIRLHLGVERPFVPARKAHPAFETPDLDALAARLASAGAPVIADADLPGYRRFFTADPFGNRIEMLSLLRA